MNVFDEVKFLEKVEHDLLSKNYRSLWDNEQLNNNIILLTLGGSHAYGTCADYNNSDVDIRGITLNTPKEILTMSFKDKPFEDKNTDTVIYPLVQIIQLLSNANPNVIEMLGCESDHYFILKDEGKLLKDNIEVFLSKRVIQSFGGYASSQLRRLQNALARDSYPQVEKEQHIMNSIKRQLIHFKNHYTNFNPDAINIYLDKSDKEEFEKEMFIDINLKHYPLRDHKNIMSEMTNVIRDYNKLNNRNKKKDQPHLLKHGMHLIRLLIMGSEILETKKVNTYRKNERELLLDIRNGKYSYDQIFMMVDEYESKFDYASNNTELPDKPDWNKINELTIEINKGVIDKWRSHM